MNKQEMVEKLKENEKALCRLSEEEQEFLREHNEHILMLCNTSKFSSGSGEWKLSQPHHVYRLHRDFQLPIEEKFFFPKGVDLLDPEKCQPEGEYDCAVEESYDNPPISQICSSLNGCFECICNLNNRAHLKQWHTEQGGQRKKGPEFEIYKIIVVNKIYYAKGCGAFLFGASSKVGFAGVKFKDIEGWHPEIVKFDAEGLPLVPEKVRFVK